MSQRIFWQPFRYRDFTLLVVAEVIYRMPIWMMCMIFGILIEHRFPHSTFYQGLVGFLYNIPILFISPFSGVLADRVHRIKILRYIQGIYLVSALLMVWWLWHGDWHLLGLYSVVLLTGMGFAVGGPALNAAVADCVPDPKVLGAAVGVFSAVGRVVQFLGYALGGILFAWGGALFCFNLSVMAFLIALLLLCLIRGKPPAAVVAEKQHPIHDLWEGLASVRTEKAQIMLLLVTAAVSFLIWPYVFQLPLLTMNYFHGTAESLGLILGVGGIGGALGAMSLTWRKSRLHITHFCLGGLLFAALGIGGLSYAHSVSMAIVAVFFLDLGLSTYMVASQTFLQQIVNEQQRGRLMGLYYVAIFGVLPISSVLYFGGLAMWTGPMRLLQLSAGLVLLLAVVFGCYWKRLRQWVVAPYQRAKLITSADEWRKI